MIKKYELIDEIKVIGHKVLHRIRALIDIPRYRVDAGDLGGFIEGESNLSHDGDCWIGNNACAYDNAQIYGNARISDNARVYGNACVYSNAHVYGKARIYDYACVAGKARVYDNALIYGNTCIFGNACIYGDACVSGEAWITQGKYHTFVMNIIMLPYGVTAIYPNHVQIGCKLFEICNKKTAIETMKWFRIPEEYHEQIWLAVRLCKRWLKDNPEKGENND